MTNRATRARDLGVPFDGSPGPLNAITDLAGIEVGHVTLSSAAVHTGVTAVFPRGKDATAPVFAGWFSLNGSGEMTGTTWIEESGFLEGPVLLTNTCSVGLVRDAVIKWQARRSQGKRSWILPVVAETYDGHLNETEGHHIKEEHVFSALDSASAGRVQEGNVGGGTGMCSFEFKSGIGTASRLVGEKQRPYTLGVLVQSNFALREQLIVSGVPVGKEISEGRYRRREGGSIVIVIAVDAPLLPHQLKRIARRASLGLARTGGTAGNASGDIFLAFSTANGGVGTHKQPESLTMLPNASMDALFEATVQATEESIINSLVAARTMTGRDGRTVLALPHPRLQELLQKYQRLAR
jgi:L-aminopeptidase/D-esterase-like protein